MFHVRSDDVGAAPGDVAHRSGNRLLVAGNRARREDDGVVGSELDEAMIVDGDTGECGLRFSLRAGRDAQHVLGRVVLNVRVADLHAGRNAKVTKPLRDLRVLHDAASDERHFAIELRRQIDEHLHAVDARGERGDDELAGRGGEQLFEGVDDLDLGAGEAAAIDVRAVGEEREHALRPQLGESMQVEVLAVDRGLIDLEVAGVDDGADGRRDRQRHAVGHAVRHADELDRERAHGHALPRLDGLEPVAGIDAVLFELGLDERQRHRRAIDRAVEQLDHVRDGADVILVPVGEDQRLDVVATRLPRSVMSGMIRSTPSWSGSGNMTPASMRMVVSSHDNAIMFMPNSPRPPRATTSSVDGDTTGTAD